MSENSNVDAQVKTTWTLLVVAWILFLIPFPGTGIIGGIVNFAAFIMAIVVMARGKATPGVIQLICSIVVSPIVYFIGLGIFAAGASAVVAEKAHEAKVERDEKRQVQLTEAKRDFLKTHEERNQKDNDFKSSIKKLEEDLASTESLFTNEKEFTRKMKLNTRISEIKSDITNLKFKRSSELSLDRLEDSRITIRYPELKEFIESRRIKE